KFYDKLIHRLDEDTTEVIKDVGQSCSCQFAFPSMLYLMLKYPDDFMEAMRQNVLAGGDSAGRGMILGMVLGTAKGYSNLPQDLVKALKAYDIIHTFTQHKMI
ncbi:MAG TPA: hypothetical protein DCS67_12810, partial [Clostridiales bacterium UBA8960]|nr:hypothetical protein [Clostridiales bacterium UBA8960]